MTMESTRYIVDSAVEDVEPMTLIHPAWVNPPEHLDVVDVGGHPFRFRRKS